QVFEAEQKRDKLICKGNKEFITKFFSLNEDFESIKNHLLKDNITRIAYQKYPGIRILQQDLWECLISFVCSSASNIPKIRKNIELLSKKFGEKNNFPKPGKIDDLKLIKECKTGFRAKYIYEINKIVNHAWLEKVKKSNYQTAKQMLIELPGVGEKIADCVCLFALRHQESFPVDVWIKRIVENNYLKKTSNYKEIQEFARKRFGKYAGYSQQYLYHWGRLNRSI
ncbi:MAG: DNA glycosylase, partial [Nanoarchaeota archaeon]|nr:DNA glycosylase [Nanoarchaeota archaeon]